MELVRGLVNLTDAHQGCVLTIGNFDGVHLGHQHVLKKLRSEAEKHGVPSVVMVFEPQPQEVFLGDKAAARILTFRDKFEKLQKLGVDRLLVVHFNKEFASLSPQTFIDELLVKKLGVKHLIVGDDFKFGKKRTGDYALLKASAHSKGFTVEDSKTLVFSETRASSTLVREFLQAGKFALVEQLLGNKFTMQGRVIHGQKNGRKFGFPTANIAVKRKVLPIKGVFVVAATVNNTQYFGVANIGNKPTLDGIKPVLEVHIFDFSHDIYGQRMTIEPLVKLRDEQKFESVDQLISQIKRDVADAKSTLSQNGIN
jgi:riboflavin kinase / FMN adenylyltransferase